VNSHGIPNRHPSPGCRRHWILLVLAGWLGGRLRPSPVSPNLVTGTSHLRRKKRSTSCSSGTASVAMERTASWARHLRSTTSCSWPRYRTRSCSVLSRKDDRAR